MGVVHKRSMRRVDDRPPYGSVRDFTCAECLGRFQRGALVMRYLRTDIAGTRSVWVCEHCDSAMQNGGAA